MSFRVTEGVMRCGQRFCSRRFLWQQHSFLVTAKEDASFPSHQVAKITGTRQCLTSLDKSFSSMRFYSQSGIHSEHLKEREQHLSSSLSDSSLLVDIQSDETVSRQTQYSSAFLDHLQRCVSPSDVLDLTCTFAPTAQHVSYCLSRMWSLTKKMTNEQRRCELQLMFKHPAFEKLLQTALKELRNMRHVSVAFALQSMVNLGVPQRSRVIQTFLRACQENLSNFDEKTLSILASCLGCMEECANVNALKMGMRLEVEARLPQIKNVVILQIMMRLVGKDAPMNLKRKLEKKALSMTDQFSLVNSQYMIITIATMGFYSRPLLDVCSKMIRENLYGIPFNKLFGILQSCRTLSHRDKDLFTDFSDYIASSIDIWTKKQVISILSIFEDLNFCPSALMGAFLEKVIANPDALTLKDLLCILKVYSNRNYDLQHQRQQFLDSLTMALVSYLPTMSEFELLKAVYYLCLLGHFPAAPLEQLLQSSTLEKFKTTALWNLSAQQEMFRLVDLCLRLDCPPLPQPLTVPPSVLGDPVLRVFPVNLKLSQCLRSVLGDHAETMLQEMVVENFYVIDAVITKPVPNHTSVTEASAGEERSPAESSQRTAVFIPPRSGFCYGTSNPCGRLAVKIRHLKILGYNPVMITKPELSSALEENLTDFLRGQIFSEHHRSDTQPEVDHLGS